MAGSQAPTAPELPAPPLAPAGPSGGLRTRLASDRACIESNLARKGLWHPGATCGTGVVQLVAVRDQLGLVERIDDGPVLGGLSFEVLVWACSRWRESGGPEARHVPFTIAGLAADLGWRKRGGATAELTRGVDDLTRATFRARVFNARHREVRIDTFGLLDRWEHGEADRRGRPSHAGMLVLGDWLHEQLRRGHVTYVSWSQLRALRGPIAQATTRVSGGRAVHRRLPAGDRPAAACHPWYHRGPRVPSAGDAPAGGSGDHGCREPLRAGLH